MAKRFDIKAVIADRESADNSFILYLLQKDERIILPIRISNKSARSIVLAKQKNESPRPHIHNTVMRLLKVLEGKVTRITISLFKNDIFYAYIRVRKDTKVFDIDSKATDALAIAIRCKAPIFVVEEVIDMAGIKVTEELLAKSLGTD